MTKTQFAVTQFGNDLAACIRLADASKAENAAARERIRNNAELVAHLEAAAQRRGELGINWAEYFRNVGL